MAEQAKKIIERRKHQRYYPDRNNQPQVHFMLNGSDKFSVDVVNISQGGLLGYTFNHKFFYGNNHRKIKDVEIVFPGKLPFHCSGKITRVQPSREKQKCFCAIQFDENGYDQNNKLLHIGEKIERSLHPMEEVVMPDQLFMARLEKAENYMKVKDSILGQEARKRVYDSFDDITCQLALEEKWWFYEIMDEAKRCEPDYPEGLKRAFINLCRVGWQQSLKNTRVRIFDKQNSISVRDNNK